MRGRLWLAVAGAFLLAGLIGGLVALLSGLAPMAAAGWALAAGAGASAAVAFGAVEQSHDRTLPVRVLQIVGGQVVITGKMHLRYALRLAAGKHAQRQRRIRRG